MSGERVVGSVAQTPSGLEQAVWAVVSLLVFGVFGTSLPDLAFALHMNK